jgi:hypothetical protein
MDFTQEYITNIITKSRIHTAMASWFKMIKSKMAAMKHGFWHLAPKPLQNQYNNATPLL